MKKMAILSVFLCSFLVMISGMMVMAGDFPGGGDALAGDLVNAVNGGLLGPKIDIAISAAVDEQDPAVAFCGGQYLVVYEADGAIYGQRVEDDGDLAGPAFVVYTDTYDASDPDVACLWTSFLQQYFVVVFSYDYEGDQSDYDVYVQAVDQDGSLFGGVVKPGYTVNQERKPAVACEEDDSYCLVVFDEATGETNHIKGRRLKLGISSLELYGDLFDPTAFGDDVSNPDVAWAKTRNEYLVIWQEWYVSPLKNEVGSPAAENYRIAYSQIYEDEQGDGVSELIGGGSLWLVYTGIGYDYDQTNPHVAFNNISGRYLAVFTGNPVGQVDAWAVVFRPDEEAGLPFSMNNKIYGTTAVAFCGGPSGDVNAVDEFLALDTKYWITDHYFLQGTRFWS